MLTLVDKPLGETRLISKNDTVFQVEVGYNQELGLRYQDREKEDPLLLSNIADNVLAVLDMCNLTPAERKLANRIFDEWREGTTMPSTGQKPVPGFCQ